MIETGLGETKGANRFVGVVIAQPRHGYRFSSDSIALARFIRISSSESLLDMGTGVGVVPLLVWQRHRYRAALGIELQQDLANFAIRNVRENGLSDKIFIVPGDLRTLAPENIQLPLPSHRESRFDVISANPPYWTTDHGRVSPNPQKALARHEIELTFDELVAACQRFLRPGGRFYFVHVAERENDVVSSLEVHGFFILKKQYADGAARRTTLLVEAKKANTF
jgi:tRNA1(Val) A37 N6-methylase TrmN6